MEREKVRWNMTAGAPEEIIPRSEKVVLGDNFKSMKLSPR